MTQNILMNMAINVYEYGRGGKCVFVFRHTYARMMQMEKEFRQIRRVMRTSVSFFLSLFSIAPVCCFVLLN